jgi:GNAT superfamily N-acetyltransferase
MKSVELEHEGLEIKFYETTTEHASKHGLKSSKPIFFNHLLVDEKKRNRGNGKGLLKMLEEYAEKNNFDLIFGSIPQNAEFSKDSRICFFSNIEMIKNWLHKNGYSLCPDNNDFYKVIPQKDKLKYYGGIGFNISSEIGNFEVITEYDKTKFTKLSEAKEHYLKIKGEKSIWDLQRDELLDAWYNI